ncbi:MAG: hypothetical protein DU489_00490 [Nitrosomonas sp.]|uniref:hypothetical protein n=1 Tax=Nitrosomonas sp. TaxID=42353 RepID=UPI0032ECC504
MNPKYQRIAARVKILIEEGRGVAALEKPAEYVGPYIQDEIPLHTWLVKVENILLTVFSEKSAHYMQAKKVLDHRPKHSYEVNQIIGILSGALSDLEDGFLVGQEQLIAAAILDSVLEQAQYLSKTGFKDPASILCRVVIEDTLQRICIEEGLTSSGKASFLNDALKEHGRYTKPQWRLIQSWLDIGNSAAHGKFTDYTEDDVKQMISDVERFVAQELSG